MSRHGKQRKRKKPEHPPGFVQCDAQVPDGEYGDTRRCKHAAKKGGRLCGMHQRARDRIDNPPLKRYVISKSFKPRRFNEDGTYRRTIVGKVFASQELAWEWARLNSRQLFLPAHKGERVCSYSVERLR